MSTTITANVSKMFGAIEPWDTCNSQANLGHDAGRITWSNAMRIAERHAEWLESPLADAVEGIREYASGFGAWDAEEIAGWSETECLALFAQEIANELRNCLDADNRDLHDCAALYEQTDWEHESEYPRGVYYIPGPRAPFADVRVDFYTGS